MEVAVVVAIIALIQGLGVAYINGVVTRDRKKEEEYVKAHFERDKTTYELLFAMSDGLEVLLKKAHGDAVNGDVEEALNMVKIAKNKLNNLCNSQIARL